MRVLGIDPGSETTGWGIIEGELEDDVDIYPKGYRPCKDSLVIVSFHLFPPILAMTLV